MVRALRRVLMLALLFVATAAQLTPETICQQDDECLEHCTPRAELQFHYYEDRALPGTLAPCCAASEAERSASCPERSGGCYCREQSPTADVEYILLTQFPPDETWPQCAFVDARGHGCLLYHHEIPTCSTAEECTSACVLLAERRLAAAENPLLHTVHSAWCVADGSHCDCVLANRERCMRDGHPVPCDFVPPEWIDENASDAVPERDEADSSGCAHSTHGGAGSAQVLWLLALLSWFLVALRRRGSRQRVG